jgi:hypothetical protein
MVSRSGIAGYRSNADLHHTSQNHDSHMLEAAVLRLCSIAVRGGASQSTLIVR